MYRKDVPEDVRNVPILLVVEEAWGIAAMYALGEVF